MEIHPYLTTEGYRSQLNLSDEKIEKLKAFDGGIWFLNTKRIVCGTFPPKKEYYGRKGYLYFASAKNQFWKHIDAIYGTNYFLASKDLKEIDRINNALDKINFCRQREFGFIDMFSKINRFNETSSSDDDIIPVETIFQNGVFTNAISKGVSTFICVYKFSFETMIQSIMDGFGGPPKIIRPYNSENVPLKAIKFVLGNKEIIVIYSPIHGNIHWPRKQAALKMAMEW
jgi:hypothetical protein